MCMRKISRKSPANEEVMNDEMTQTHTISKVPLYEDIDMESKTNTIQTNNNIAHGAAQNSKQQ